jgi:hypothetical protein
VLETAVYTDLAIHGKKELGIGIPLRNSSGALNIAQECTYLPE